MQRSCKGPGRVMVVWAIVVALLGVACGREGVRPEAIATGTPGPTSLIIGEYVLLPINTLAHWGDAAVVGTVTAVSEPRWNQNSGEPWKNRDGEPTAWRYRDVTVGIERVLWSSEELTVVTGDELVVRFYGDGSASGVWIEPLFPERYPHLSYGNQQSGPVETGTSVLFVLAREPFVWREGPVDAVVLVNGFQTNWTVRDGVAYSADPKRTVAVEALIDRLKTERARGLDPSDRRGLRDPLEEQQPPAPE